MVEAVESPDIDTFNIWGDETDAKPKRNIVNQESGIHVFSSYRAATRA